MFDFGETDLFQASGAAAAVLEVHLSEGFGRDLLQELVSGALLLCIEEAGRVVGRQGDREVAEAGVVRGAYGAV